MGQAEAGRCRRRGGERGDAYADLRRAARRECDAAGERLYGCGGQRDANGHRCRVSGSTVELTLDSVVEHGETGIKVSYKVPRGVGASPTRDAVGNAAAALSNVAVTNETPDTSPPKVSTISFSSNPGTDRTYAAGDDIQVTVTFTKAVAVTGSPQLTLNVGGEGPDGGLWKRDGGGLGVHLSGGCQRERHRRGDASMRTAFRSTEERSRTARTTQTPCSTIGP